MAPSLFNHRTTECYVRTYEQQDGVDNKRMNDKKRRSTRTVLSVPDRFVRDWTWSRKWPLAPIAEEYDPGTQATLKCSRLDECKLMTSRIKNKKVVSFSSCCGSVEDVGCHPIMHVDDMTEQQKIDMWWTPNDFAAMRKVIAITHRRARILGGLDDDDEGYCTRGIEALSTNASQLRKERRRAAVDLVLKCQQQQRCEMTGYVDIEFIAQVYAAFCELDRMTAILIAASDAADAAATLIAGR